MIVYVGILAFIGVITMQVFRSTVRTWRETADRQSAQMRFDIALQRLRTDVWSASKIELADDHTLVLHFPTQTDVTWHSEDASTSLSRIATDKSESCRWERLGKLAFTVKGPTVALHVAENSGDSEGEVVLMSQAMLLKGTIR
jgi:hypothetical protein